MKDEELDLAVKKLDRYRKIIKIRNEDRIFLRAIARNDFDIFKLARQTGCKWHEKTTMYAAKLGRYDFMKYAHENGCKWHNETCANAAVRGHLTCLQYACENGAPMYCVLQAAALGGNLECLKYAHDRALSGKDPSNSLNYDVFVAAQGKGKEHIVEYLRSHACPEKPSNKPPEPIGCGASNSLINTPEYYENHRAKEAENRINTLAELLVVNDYIYL